MLGCLDKHEPRAVRGRAVLAILPAHFSRHLDVDDPEDARLAVDERTRA